MRRLLIASVSVAVMVGVAPSAGAAASTVRVTPTSRDVGALTQLFTTTMRARHDFSVRDRATAYVARSWGAASSPDKGWNDSSVLAVSYHGATYAYASFFLIKGDSFRSQVSMQDGWSEAIFIAHHGSWRPLEIGTGWPPCNEAALAKVVSTPVAQFFWGDACSPTR